MIEIPTANRSNKVWRYLRFERFVWLLLNQALWLSRADLLEDSWEAAPSAIQACLVSPKAAGRTFHVTDGFAVSTPGLVRSIATAFGKSARLFAFPPALIELLGAAVGRGGRAKSLTRSLELDDRGIRSELGWKPIQTFESGLAETVNWYSALHKSAR